VTIELLQDEKMRQAASRLPEETGKRRFRVGAAGSFS
jgi:hypothetical protein